MSRNKRLKAVAEGFASVMAAKPLPSEREKLNELQDAALFKMDVEGAATDGPLVAPKTSVTKQKKSTRKPTHPDTLKKITKMAETITSVAKTEEAPVDPQEQLTSYEKPALRDFWAAGEAGLPAAPSRAAREFSRKNANQVLSEWNIHTTAFLSAKRTQKFHERNKKKDAPELVPLSGLSYNPSAKDHAEAITTLAKAISTTAAEVEQRKEYRQRIKNLHEKIKREEESRMEGDSDNELENDDDKTGDDVHFPQRISRKTRAQRHKEEKLRALLNEKTTKEKEKKLINDLNRITKIAKEVEKETVEQGKKLANRKAAALVREEKPHVVLNGKRVPLTKMLGAVPMPAVLAPSQLPDKMRKIPGVGGVIEEEYLKMRMRKEVESGKPRARGKKAAIYKKAHKVEKFNLDELTKHTAKPRFKIPAKLQQPKASDIPS